MPQLRLTPTLWKFLAPGGLLLLVLLLASCGAANGTASSAAVARPQAQNQPAKPFPPSDNKSAGVTDKLRMPPSQAQQRLIKTLNVTISEKDTRQTANALQAWIGSTDPQATSIGTNYEQNSDNTYTITLNLSVQSTLYPKIYSYLSNYAPKDGGQLLSLNETVQDVTNEYVDTQARIENDQNELQRLRDLMQHTGSMSDILTVEQQITATEGDIETMQAQLNQLNNQTTMYTVNITIQPISTAAPIQPSSGWNIGDTLHSALSASLAFGQGLVNFIIWLLAFSVYIIPVIILVLIYRRYRARHSLQPARPAYYRPTPPSSPVNPTPAQPSAPSQPVPVGATVAKTDLPEEEEAVPASTPMPAED